MTFLAALVLFGILGTSIPSDKDIARDIEHVIREQFHPQSVQVTVSRRALLTTTLQRVDITITGFDAKSLVFAAPAAAPAAVNRPGDIGELRAPARGRHIRIVDLHLTCNKFTAEGLPIQQMTWRLHDVSVPMDAVGGRGFPVSSASTATGSLHLQQDGVAQYLRTRDLPLDTPVVTLTTDGCRISGRTRSFIRVPVTVSGCIGVRDKAVLFLDDPKLHVSAVRLPDFMTDRLLKGVDPLMDLNTDLTLPAPLTITKIVHEQGAIRFDAALAFPRPE